MSDDFERKLREHLYQEAAEIREVPRPLRGRVRDVTHPPSPFGRRVPQLALAAVAGLAVGALVFGWQNSQAIINTLPAGIRQLLQPTPTPHPFTCSNQSGGNAGLTAQLTAIRWAGHEGYDRVVFDFSTGIPSYDLTRQPSATFIKDPSGEPVALEGAAGLKILLRNTDGSPNVPQDSKPALPVVREVAQLGAFEGVLSYGLGLSAPACQRVLELSNPPRLVVDFSTSTPAPTASSTPVTSLKLRESSRDSG